MSARFSTSTLPFLEKAGRQKNEKWLERNRAEFEEVLLDPVKHLAQTLKTELSPLVPHYNFPQKGIGRLKRSKVSVDQRGGGVFKNWMSYSAARARQSRFETHPNLFFLINSEDQKDPVLLAGGLYMPSSRQLRSLREAVANEAVAAEFEALFATKEFSKVFPGGFSDERISSRSPRGFDPAHPRMRWLRLQAFFVWKPYSIQEFMSRNFAESVAKDCRQIIRMNDLIEKALDGTLVPAKRARTRKAASPLDRLSDVGKTERSFDF